MASFDQELAFAHELADRAADIGLEVFGRDFEVRRKDDRSPVTEADTRIEAMIREALAGRFPGDAVLGEEGGREGSGSRLWIVDPIDGTKNFAARHPDLGHADRVLGRRANGDRGRLRSRDR